MPTSPNGLPYPILGGDNNPPADLQALALAVDGVYGGAVANVAALPAVGEFDGQRIFCIATRETAVWDGTQWTGIATGFNPTWTTSITAPSLGNGTLTGSYRVTGKKVEFRVALTIGSTTTVGTGHWFFTLPVVPLDGTPWGSEGTLFDASVPAYYAIKGIWDGSSLSPWCDGATAGVPLRFVASATPIVWAVGDVVYLSGTYEAA